MSAPGEVDPADLLVRARSALLDVLEGLADQRAAVVVIGAQAVYLRTGGVDVALAEATKDSDVALDPRQLAEDPRVEAAMRAAGFLPSINGQPGAWVNPEGIPVYLMVPERLAGGGGSSARAARVPPHDKRSMRRARGIEAALIDNDLMDVASLDSSDGRSLRVKVAGPAALLIAKLHKIAERASTPHRLDDKDAHDVYRLLRAVETEAVHSAVQGLLVDPLSAEVTEEAIGHLDALFASGAGALGAQMAGRAEEGVGDPEQVSVAVAILAGDLLVSLRSS